MWSPNHLSKDATNFFKASSGLGGGATHASLGKPWMEIRSVVSIEEIWIEAHEQFDFVDKMLLRYAS